MCIVCESVYLISFQEIRSPPSSPGVVSPCLSQFDNVFLYTASCCLNVFKCLFCSVFYVYV